jgi:hypothetical protein
VTNEAVREILAEAAAYIAEHGWTQGEAFEGEGNGVAEFNWEWVAASTPPACALGGIYYASSRHPWEDMCAARLALAAAIENVPVIGDLSQTQFASTIVAEWNDRDERSAEDVILMIKKAAEL